MADDAEGIVFCSGALTMLNIATGMKKLGGCKCKFLMRLESPRLVGKVCSMLSHGEAAADESASKADELSSGMFVDVGERIEEAVDSSADGTSSTSSTSAAIAVGSCVIGKGPVAPDIVSSGIVKTVVLWKLLLEDGCYSGVVYINV